MQHQERQRPDAPEGNRVKDENIWDMVNYVRSLSKKGEEKPAEEKAPDAKPADEKPVGDKPQ